MTDDTMVEWWAETLCELQRDPVQSPWKRAHPDVKAYWRELATALLPLVREAQAEAWESAIPALSHDAVGFKDGVWSASNEADMQSLDMLAKALEWLRTRAATYRTGDDHAR